MRNQVSETALFALLLIVGLACGGNGGSSGSCMMVSSNICLDSNGCHPVVFPDGSQEFEYEVCEGSAKNLFSAWQSSEGGEPLDLSGMRFDSWANAQLSYSGGEVCACEEQILGDQLSGDFFVRECRYVGGTGTGSDPGCFLNESYGESSGNYQKSENTLLACLTNDWRDLAARFPFLAGTGVSGQPPGYEIGLAISRGSRPIEPGCRYYQ